MKNYKQFFQIGICIWGIRSTCGRLHPVLGVRPDGICIFLINLTPTFMNMGVRCPLDPVFTRFCSVEKFRSALNILVPSYLVNQDKRL